MLQFAEIITEPQPTTLWSHLVQMGVTRAVAGLPRGAQDWRGLPPPDQPWSYTPIRMYQELLGECGLEIAVVEDNPPLDDIRFGLPGRDDALDNVKELIRSMSKVGIPTWCYSWVAGIGWVRTQMATQGRGGALVAGYRHTALDHSELTRYGRVTADELWANLEWFLERILPFAEDHGVRLALHPDDPPTAAVRGIDRIMNTPAAFDRLFETFPSPANTMTMCQGNFTLMTDDLPGEIRRYGADDRIAFVHFRDVRGTPEDFIETFHDEGPTDMLACMRAYRDIGYEGVMRSDHVPLMSGDRQVVPGYGDISRLYAIGYMTGLREAAYAEPA